MQLESLICGDIEHKLYNKMTEAIRPIKEWQDTPTERWTNAQKQEHICCIAAAVTILWVP